MSLIRVTLLFAVWSLERRCKHSSDRQWRALLWDALCWRSRHFRLHPRTSSGEDDPVGPSRGCQITARKVA